MESTHEVGVSGPPAIFTAADVTVVEEGTSKSVPITKEAHASAALLTGGGGGDDVSHGKNGRKKGGAARQRSHLAAAIKDEEKKDKKDDYKEEALHNNNSDETGNNKSLLLPSGLTIVPQAEGVVNDTMVIVGCSQTPSGPPEEMIITPSPREKTSSGAVVLSPTCPSAVGGCSSSLLVPSLARKTHTQPLTLPGHYTR